VPEFGDQSRIIDETRTERTVFLPCLWIDVMHVQVQDLAAKPVNQRVRNVIVGQTPGLGAATLGLDPRQQFLGELSASLREIQRP